MDVATLSDHRGPRWLGSYISLALAITCAQAGAQPRAASRNDAAALRALAWLESRVASPDWRSIPLSKANLESKRHVIAAMTAWLEELYPERDADPQLVAQLELALARAVRLESLVGEVFANWTQGFAAFAVFERDLRGRPDRDLEKRLVAGFEERQNAEGGWNHGMQLGSEFYPSTLIATANLALLTLGLARRAGLELDDKVLED